MQVKLRPFNSPLDNEILLTSITLSRPGLGHIDGLDQGVTSLPGSKSQAWECSGNDKSKMTQS